MRRFVALVVLAMLTGFAPPVAAKVYDPAFYTLANGLRIVVVPNRRAPVVHHMLWYKVGAADEEPGKSGLAHYLEHLMFKGTAAMPPGAYSKIIALHGGSDNAFTSHDVTAYFATVPADFLPQLMAMEADRMQGLALTADVARPELDVVLAERRQRTDDDPQGRFAEKMGQAVFGDHPYGRPVIGWRKEIADMDDAAATEFYRQWYAPNNAVLIVSGDVTPEKIAALAAATYGGIAPKKLPPRADLQANLKSRAQPETLTLKDPDVQQPLLQKVMIAPSYRATQGREAYALQVLAEILDGGAVGRLYKQLVVRQKLATGIDADYNPSVRGMAEFTILLALIPGLPHERVSAALDELLREIAQRGVSHTEVAQAIKRLQRQAVFARDSLQAPGHVFGQALTTGGTIAEVEDWPQRIGAVTLRDVNAAAAKLLNGTDSVTGILLPGGDSKSGKITSVRMPQGEIR